MLLRSKTTTAHHPCSGRVTTRSSVVPVVTTQIEDLCPLSYVSARIASPNNSCTSRELIIVTSHSPQRQSSSHHTNIETFPTTPYSNALSVSLQCAMVFHVRVYAAAILFVIIQHHRFWSKEWRLWKESLMLPSLLLPVLVPKNDKLKQLREQLNYMHKRLQKSLRTQVFELHMGTACKARRNRKAG